MAVLDTSGLWSAGDDYRLIKALQVPLGRIRFRALQAA